MDLSNLDVESVFAAVPEVFLPTANVHADKRNIHPVLLHQVRAVLTVFIAGPIVIIVVLPIIIAPFTLVVVGNRRDRGDQGCGRRERARN
jgi:hypothetical protein